MYQIDRYKIKGHDGEYLDDRYHHVPKHLTSEFQEKVFELGKQWELKPSLSYKIDEEEYETNPDNASNVHHPLDKINHQELGDILDPIEIYFFGVKNSQTQEKLRFYVPSNSVDSFTRYKEKEGYTFDAKLGARNFSTARYQKLCEAPPPDIIPIRIGADEDDLAREFEEELTKRNINKEDLIMTTSIQEQNKSLNLSNEKAMMEKDLMKYLGSCTREFLDELVLTFNDEEALQSYQYAHSTKKKRGEIYRLIVQNVDVDKFHIVKDFYNYVSGSAEDIAKAKKEYQETMTSYKSGLQSRVEGIRLQFEIKPETRDYQKQILGQMECCKLIENGLKGYGKAVVAGHVIGKEDQVVAAANYIAVEASQIVKHQDLSDKSLEGVKKLVKNVNSGINNLVATLHDENGELNAKANSLVAETVEQRKQMTDKINQFVSQPVNEK